MFGICTGGNLKVPINGSLFTIKEVTGPLRRGGAIFPARVQYARCEILLVRNLPGNVKMRVLAAAISEACLRHRVRIIEPRWDRRSL